MHVVILHQIGKRASQVQKRMKYENIQSEALNIHSYETEKICEKLLKAHALILFIKSPLQKDPLLMFPDLMKRCRLKIPVLCLDEKEDSESKLFAQRSGVSFYLPTPFSFPEIALKLKWMVYRKNRTAGTHVIRIGDLTIDFLAHSMKRRSEIIPLRNREFALMEYLALNRGKTLTRNMILESVWDRNTSILSNTIDVHISRLRQKLETSGKEYFQTVHAIGYKFEPQGKEKH